MNAGRDREAIAVDCDDAQASIPDDFLPQIPIRIEDFHYTEFIPIGAGNKTKIDIGVLDPEKDVYNVEGDIQSISKDKKDVVKSFISYDPPAAIKNDEIRSPINSLNEEQK